MLETFCLSVLGSGGVAGIFFALIRHYIERRLMEVEAREQERIKYKIEQRKAEAHKKEMDREVLAKYSID